VSRKIDSLKNRKDLIDRSTACIALIWLGMVLGISFLEAPVKFMAPSVTLEIGLDIGRYVFRAFNKVECVFALVIAILLIIIRRKNLSMVPIGLACLSLALQTAWLLPFLDCFKIETGFRDCYTITNKCQHSVSNQLLQSGIKKRFYKNYLADFLNCSLISHMRTCDVMCKYSGGGLYGNKSTN